MYPLYETRCARRRAARSRRTSAPVSELMARYSEVRDNPFSWSPSRARPEEIRTVSAKTADRLPYPKLMTR